MKKVFIGLLLLALALPVYGAQISGGGATLLNGQPSSYYLSRANHTGTQADSTLDTITTAGKVSGNTITSGTIAGSTAINTTGVITAGAFVGSLESYSTNIAQILNIGLADNDTDSLIFDFVPSKILLHYSGMSETLAGDRGTTTGNCLVRTTGNNTFVSTLNYSASSRAATTGLYVVPAGVATDTTNVIVLIAGGNAVGVVGTATWTTATKTLLITYQETGTTTATNFVEMVATAYR